MGWNKRSSGHKYDSLSGHAFIIGVYTRRIIDYVVFSKSCSICNTRTRKNKNGNASDSEISSPLRATGPNGSASDSDNSSSSTFNTPTRADAASLLSSCSPLHATGPNGSASASDNSSHPNTITPQPLDAAAFLKGSRRQREPITTNVIDVSLQDHFCTRNYDGSSGGMESDGLLLIMTNLYAKSKGKTYLDMIVTDDDTSITRYRS